jgi:hypothetical protein
MLSCRMSDGKIAMAATGWSLVWCRSTKAFVVMDPHDCVGIPNISRLLSIAIESRRAFLVTARNLARQAGCKPMLGQDKGDFVRVFLSYPWPEDDNIGNWGQPDGEPAPI